MQFVHGDGAHFTDLALINQTVTQSFIVPNSYQPKSLQPTNGLSNTVYKQNVRISLFFEPYQWWR